MTARALQQTTGLSVDNSEALGALSDAAVEESDLIAGRFDGAEVCSWLLNWADPAQRIAQFRGNFGEVTRSAGAFKAELRGLTDRMNQPQGRVFPVSYTHLDVYKRQIFRWLSPVSALCAARFRSPRSNMRAAIMARRPMRCRWPRRAL